MTILFRIASQRSLLPEPEFVSKHCLGHKLILFNKLALPKTTQQINRKQHRLTLKRTTSRTYVLPYITKKVEMRLK